MIYLFLIPFVEHLTERTKEYIAGLLEKKNKPVYLSHHLAPVFSLVWSLILVWIIGGNSDLPARVLILSGGSIIYYELSHIWKGMKRKNVPLHVSSLEDVALNTDSKKLHRVIKGEE